MPFNEYRIALFGNKMRDDFNCIYNVPCATDRPTSRQRVDQIRLQFIM